MSRCIRALFESSSIRRRSSNEPVESPKSRRARLKNAPKSHKSSLEPLEDRALLSVSVAEYEAIREAYPSLNLPETVETQNVVEIDAADVSIETLKAAIAAAETTKTDDLILIRTTDEFNKITFASASDEITIDFDSSKYGALNIVAFGTKTLTIDAAQQARVLYVSKGTTGLANMTITGGKSDMGGGIYVRSGAFTLTNTEISENSASHSGGGVYVYSGVFVSTNTTILRNSAYFGGGVYVDSGSFTSTNTMIAENSASNYGGGVNVDSGSFVSTNTTISRNSAHRGGAVSVYEGGSFTSTNTVISANFANNTGGGVYVPNGKFKSTNVTISGNSADDVGGVFVGSSAGMFAATNTIVIANYGENLSGPFSSSSSNNLIRYYPSFVCAPVFDGNGKLTNADSLDLRLRSDSSAIDAGTNDAVEGISTDCDGKQRVYNGSVDIGAYEYQGDRDDEPFYSTVVDTLHDSFDLNDGEWSLREAIYYATKYETITFAEDLNGTIRLARGELEIDRALAIDGDGKIVIDANQQSRVASVHCHINETPVVLKGLTLQNGKVSGHGGGVYLSGALQTANVVIRENRADAHTGPGSYMSGPTYYSYYGGGVYLASGSFTATNTTISGNSAQNGGGVYVQNGIFTASNTEIVANRAFCLLVQGSAGGGVYVGTGKFTATNSTISGNSASFDSYRAAYSSGGGVYIGSGTFTTTNTTISDNSSYYGGGVYAYGSFTATNTTISGNSASSGGGVYFVGKASNLYNSIIVFNTAESKVDVSSSEQITGSNNLSTYVNWDGNDNYVYDARLPLFVDALNGDYRLVPGSQATDKGDSQYAYDAGLNEESLDPSGVPRFAGGSIDVGAYESYSATFSQRSVFCGDVEIAWTRCENAESVRLTWVSGTSSALLGTFDAEGKYVWSTTDFDDAYGNLIFEVLDADGKIVLSSTTRGLILNDANVVVHRGEITESETWIADKVHLVVDKSIVKSGATLTIEPNAVVKFWSRAYLSTEKDSSLNVGDAAVLTRVEDDSVGGDTNKDGALSVPKIGNAYFRGTGVINIGSDVSMKYVITTTSGKLKQNETWVAGQVYHITGNVVVPSGVTLTIAPGAVVKFNAGCSLTVQSGGKLVAEGTKAQPIIFTSVKDDEYGGDTNEDDGEYAPEAGDWVGILVKGGMASLNYAKVLYGGSDSNNSDDGAVFVSSGSATIRNSEISHSKFVGTHSGSGATLNVVNTVISDCMYATHNGNYTNCVLTDLTYLMNTNYYYYGGSFVNCVISNVSKSFYSSNTPSNYQFKNCVFYNPKDVGQQSFSAVGSNGNIWANPLFRDATNGNYRLSAGSPCIDAGTLEGAPELDADGTPRYDDLYTANNRDSYVDIGAYEFADGASSSIDLEPVDVQAPANVSVGETITVQWTIRNNGTVAAVGTWKDAIYFVGEGGKKVLAAQVAHSGSIASGDLQTFYAQIVIPKVTTGAWTVAVQVNPNREIFEGAASDDNFLKARAVTNVDVSTLVLSDSFEVSTTEQIYKLVVPAGEEYYLKYSYADSSSYTNVAMKARIGYLPTDLIYDSLSSSVQTTNLSTETFENVSVLHIPAANTEQTIYVSLSSTKNATIGKLERVYGGFQTFGICNAIYYDSSFAHLQEERYYSTVQFGEKSSLTIVGTGFIEGMTAVLCPTNQYSPSAPWYDTANWSAITGEVRVLSSTTAVLTFDMNVDNCFTAAYSKNYDLVLAQNGATQTFENAILARSIDARSATSIIATLDVPESVRVGRTYVGYILYENTSSSEQFVPVFTVSGNVSFGLTSNDVDESSLRLLGLGTRTPGLLEPGESGKVPFYFVAGEKTQINFASWISDNTSREMFENEYWSTWAEFHADLSIAVDQLATRGSRSYNYDSTVNFLEAQKAGKPSTGLSGLLLSADYAVPLADCIIEASWIENAGAETEVVCYDYATTDEDGFYVFNFLPQNAEITLELATGAYDLSQTKLTLTEDRDVLNFNMTARPFGSASGRVVDQDGRGVPNVDVVLTNENGDTVYATTDRYGCYECAELKLGTYEVACVSYGKFKSVESRDILVEGVEPITGVNFSVDTGASISGVVVDSENNPIENALVSVVDLAGNRYCAYVDETGAYVLAGFEAGTAMIVISADGYVEIEETVELVDETTNKFDVNLSLGYVLTGTVSTNTDENVVDFCIALTDADGKTYWAQNQEENGGYQVGGLKPGVYTANVYSTEGYLNQTTEIEISESQTYNFVWQSFAVLSGVVVDSNANPFGGLMLTLSNGDAYYQTATTRATGAYSFNGLIPGIYELTVDGIAQKWTVVCDGTQLEQTQDVTLDFVGKVSVRATDSNDVGVPYAEIQIFKQGDETEFVSNLYTDENGEIAIYFREEGTYDLYASCSSGIFAPLTNLVVKSGSEVELNTTLGTKSATATCLGLPSLQDEESEVVLYWTIGRLDADGYVIESFDGKLESVDDFIIDGLIVGDYKICASYANFSAVTSFSVGESGSNVITLEFEEKATLTVTVSLPEGTNADLAETNVWLYDSENKYVDSVTTNAEGVLNFSFLENGKYTLVVLNGRYAKLTTIMIEELTETATVTLEETTITITGTVTLDGELVEGATILVENEAGIIVGTAYSDHDGNYVLYALEAESYRITAYLNEDVGVFSSDLISDVVLLPSEIPLVSNDITVTSLFTYDTVEEISVSSAVLSTNGLVDDVVTNIKEWWSNTRYVRLARQRGYYDEIYASYTLYHFVPYNCCSSCGYEFIRYERLYGNMDDSAKNASVALKKLDEANRVITDNYVDLTGNVLSLAGTIIGYCVPGGALVKAFNLISAGTSIYSVCNSLCKSGDVFKGYAQDIKKSFESIKEYNIGELAKSILDLTSEIRNILSSGDSIKTICDANRLNELKPKAQFVETKIKALQNICTSIATKLSKIDEELRLIGDLPDNDPVKKVMTTEREIRKVSLVATQEEKIGKLNANIAIKGEVGKLISSFKNVLNVFSVLDVIGIFEDCCKIRELYTKYDEAYVECNNKMFEFRDEVRKMTDNFPCYSTDNQKLPKCTNPSCRCHKNEPPKDNPKDKKDPKQPQSSDPNEIIGVIGYDYVAVNTGTEEEPFSVITTPNWISADTDVEQNYKIYFENKSTATAAAQEVFVTMQLPDGFDRDSFELGEVCIGSQIFDVPNGYVDGLWTVNQTSTGDQIQISVDYDPSTGLAKWYLRSYVASTGDHFPASAYDGFLPPNNKETGAGEGYVSFVVKLADDLTTGATVETNATIIFDVNEPITTNTWLNTIDADVPTVALLSVENNNNGSATLTWESSDVGSGVVGYDVYYSVDGGDGFTLWTSTTETSATFVAPVAGYCSFYVVARDGVGNEGASEVSEPVLFEWTTDFDVLYGGGWLRVEASGGADGLTYWWDFTGSELVDENNFVQGERTLYLDVDELGLSYGDTTTIRLIVKDGVRVSLPVEKSVAIRETSVRDGASLDVRETSIADGRGVKFEFNAVREDGRPVSVWEIAWGDGTTTRSENLSTSWTAAHYYAQDGAFDISLKATYLDGSCETFWAFSTQTIGTPLASTQDEFVAKASGVVDENAASEVAQTIGTTTLGKGLKSTSYNSDGEVGAEFACSVNLTAGNVYLVAEVAESLFAAQEGNWIRVAAGGEDVEGLTYWWDISGSNRVDGDNFVQGEREFYFDPKELGLEVGETATIRLIVKDDETASAPVETSVVLERAQPTIKADVTTLNDGQVLSLSLSVSQVVSEWIIDWDDGSTSEYESLGDSLTAGHYYAAQSVEQNYVVTLTVIDLNGYGADESYEIASFTTPAKTKPVGTTATEGDLTTFVTNEFCDAEKSSTSNSNLCWAAGASNALYYAGWATSDALVDVSGKRESFESEDDVYSYFAENFDNGGSSVLYAFEWFITGDYPGDYVVGWAQRNEESGGFYSGVDFSDVAEYYSYRSSKTPETIIQVATEELENGWAVCASLGFYSSAPTGSLRGAHTLSVWGFVVDETCSSDDPNYYKALIISDPDDAKYRGRSADDKLVTVQLEWFDAYDRYRLTDYSSSSSVWLEELITLAPRASVSAIPNRSTDLFVDVAQAPDLESDFVATPSGENYEVKENDFDTNRHGDYATALLAAVPLESQRRARENFFELFEEVDVEEEDSYFDELASIWA